jgi:hypothetical protein
MIHGQLWETKLLHDGNHNPPRGWSNPEAYGTMRVLSKDVAVPNMTVIGDGWEHWSLIAIQKIDVSGDSAVTLHYEGAMPDCDVGLAGYGVEWRRRVVIVRLVQGSDGKIAFCSGGGVPSTYEIELTRPLGQRRVISGYSPAGATSQ